MAKKDSKDSKNESKVKKHFFKDFKAELKKVIWPTPKQLVNNTVTVITIVIVIALIVFVLDFAFEKMNTYGINKLKEMVDSKNSVTENIEQTTDENITVEDNATENTEATTSNESEVSE